jgi:hypothetical protein
MPVPTIESVFPSDNSLGVVIGTQVFVIFSDEIDISSIPGSFVVEALIPSIWTGPDMVLLDRPDTEETENILESPSFKGIVQGVYTTEYLDSGGTTVSGPDTSGLGSGNTTFKHKVIFTPNHLLSPSTQYRVYLGGDEDLSDNVNIGVSSRTVFDAAKGLNTGDGDLVPSGGYRGTVDDRFVFEITNSGSFGVAQYEWYRESESFVIRTGYVSKSSLTLNGGEGLVVNWSGLSATPFVLGDTFSVQVRSPVYMEESFTWVFTTGSGNIIGLPSGTSTSPLGDIGVAVPAALEVVSVSPDIRESGVSLDTNVIAITFNKAIYADSVTDLDFDIVALSVNGDSSISSLGRISKILRVNDKTIYAILQSPNTPIRTS